MQTNRTRCVVLFAFIVATLSCGQRNHRSDAPAPEDPSQDPPHEESSLTLTYNTSFAELIDDIQKDQSGRVWIAHSVKKDPEAKVVSFIEKRDREGKMLGSLTDLGEMTFAGFTTFDGGSAAVAAYVEGGAHGAEYSLKLMSLDPAGKVSIEKNFEDYQLKTPDDYKCQLDAVRYGFFGLGSVRIARAGENIALLTYNCFYSRLSLLDKNLDMIWSKEITTQRDDTMDAYGSERIAVTAEGSIITTSQINDREVSQFNERFHDTLKPIGDSDILINAYDQSGSRLYSGIIGTENHDASEGIALLGETIYVAADTIVNRPTSVRDFQRDIWIAAFDTAKKEFSWSKTIDIKDEETVDAIAIVEGKFIAVGGSTGRLQVPSWSIVKHGDAFLLLTDLTGNVVGQTVFGTPRSDYIASIVDMGDERVLVGGGKDGPITHDGDSDKTQLHRFGFIDTLRLSDVIGH